MAKRPTDFMSALAAQYGGDDEPDAPKIGADIEAVKLRDALEAYQRVSQFKVGDIVRQKPGAGLYNNFGENDLAIVVEILDEPIFSEGEVGTFYFHQNLTMRVGSIEHDTFGIFHVDHQRFEHAPADVLRLIRAQDAA